MAANLGVAHLLEGKSREVDIAAGDDDSQFGKRGGWARGEIQAGDCAWAQQGSDGYGAAWFDNDFHAFPD